MLSAWHLSQSKTTKNQNEICKEVIKKMFHIFDITADAKNKKALL
jgi:hypothetical protein